MNWQNEMSSEGLQVHILSDDIPPSPQMELLEKGHCHERESRTIHIGSIICNRTVAHSWAYFANKGQVPALCPDLL